MDQTNVPNLMNQAKVIELSVMAYYKFNKNGFKYLDDEFRPQSGKVVNAVDAIGKQLHRPTILADGVSNTYCDSMPST